MSRADNCRAAAVSSTWRLRTRRAFASLALAVIAGGFGSAALATELTPNRYNVYPGDSVFVTVTPSMSAKKPAGARLFLAREGTGRSLGPELHLSDWKGNSFVAEFPCNARYDSSYGVLVLAREASDDVGHSLMGVLATSGSLDQRTRTISVKAGKGASCAGRLKWDATSPVTRAPATGPLSQRPNPNEPSSALTQR